MEFRWDHPYNGYGLSSDGRTFFCMNWYWVAKNSNLFKSYYNDFFSYAYFKDFVYLVDRSHSSVLEGQEGDGRKFCSYCGCW